MNIILSNAYKAITDKQWLMDYANSDYIKTLEYIYFIDRVVVNLTRMGLMFLCYSIFLYISRKDSERKIYGILKTVISLALVVYSMCYLYDYVSSSGSVYIQYIAMAFALTSVIYIFNLFEMYWQEFLALFSTVLHVISLSYFYETTLSPVITSAFFLIILAITLRMTKGKIKGNVFVMWINFIFMTFEYHVLGLVLNIVRIKGYSFGDSAVAKLVFWFIVMGIIVVINLGIIYLIKKILNKYFSDIIKMGAKYPTIERYYIFITIGIIAVCSIFYFIYSRSFSWETSKAIGTLITIFALFAFTLQLFYLTLLFKTTYLKDELYYKEQYNQRLSTYSSGLEKNLSNMQNIKHDIKNIFITMGQFVENSDNEDMKAFYNEKIYPFASDAIKKNDIYSKLSSIPNEELKAFLYYKVSQALERGIKIGLDVEIESESDSLLIDIMDLTRVLGIFMDNAIEECEEINDNSFINIEIRHKKTGHSYSIENSIRNIIKEKGIKLGVSTKGKNRGTGLLIAKEILDNYNSISYNSIFKDNSFVQKINIYVN